MGNGGFPPKRLGPGATVAVGKSRRKSSATHCHFRILTPTQCFQLLLNHARVRLVLRQRVLTPPFTSH